jgi:hypothetical protein
MESVVEVRFGTEDLRVMDEANKPKKIATSTVANTINTVARLELHYGLISYRHGKLKILRWF